MSEFQFPDEADVPKIVHDPDDPFEFTPTKTLFIQFDDEEWEDNDVNRTVETINYLFGPEVQIAVIPKTIELLNKDDLAELIEELKKNE